MAMATKLLRIVTYFHGLQLTIMLREFLIKWSYEIMCSTKTIISPLPQCQT